MTSRMHNDLARLLCCATWFSAWVPGISTYSVYSDHIKKLTVRGFNLIEFSWLGWIVFLMPLLWIVLTFTPLSEQKKTILFRISGAAVLFCLVVSTAAAVQWLHGAADTKLEIENGFVVFVVNYAVTIFWLTVGPRKDLVQEDSDLFSEET